MAELVLHPTSLAQWYELVNEAEGFIGNRLQIDLENYLVLMLQRFSNKPDMVSSVLALDFLQSLEKLGSERLELLRDVADKCLIFSGLFPGRAEKRRVSVSYFVDVGRQAYSYLSSLQRESLMMQLYAELRDYFVYIMDILFSMRELSGEKSDLTLLQAEDLWRKTGSRYALTILKRHNENVVITRDTSHVRVH